MTEQKSIESQILTGPAYRAKFQRRGQGSEAVYIVSVLPADAAPTRRYSSGWQVYRGGDAAEAHQSADRWVSKPERDDRGRLDPKPVEGFLPKRRVGRPRKPEDEKRPGKYITMPLDAWAIAEASGNASAYIECLIRQAQTI